MRDFVETQVLWHGNDRETLEEIFRDYQDFGEESEFVTVTTNLARKFHHAEVGEPETPDPDAPVVEPEAHSMESGEGTEANLVKEEGPSSSKKRKGRDEDSGGGR